MSNDIQKADQIAFHFYTKLFYVVNDARATEAARSQPKVDKWFNLETPDSDLFSKESREPYKNISQSSPSGPPPLEIQVVLAIPELTNNQVLVYMSPDSSRVRIEPTPKFIVLETWTLECAPHRAGSSEPLGANADIALPIIYKHGIVLFRSLFSLLRILPTWKFFKRLRRRTGGMSKNGNLGIQLHVKPLAGERDDRIILNFGDAPSPSYRRPLSTSTHTFATIPHILGVFTLSVTYLDAPNFQLDELESLLSSRFISLDKEEFVPTLEKHRQRDSFSGSSLPNSSGIRSVLSRSPPRQIARATSGGGVVGTTAGGGGLLHGVDSMAIAERFILPGAIGTSASTGSSALIPPPRPFPSTNPTANTSLTSSPSGVALNRFRKESMNSSGSSSMSIRDYPPTIPGAGGTSSPLSSSPSTGAVPIRKPSIFKSNTVSNTGSSPSLSIRGVPSSLSRESGVVGGPATTAGAHSRQASSNSPLPSVARLPPSPIGSAFNSAITGTPSSFGDRRPGTSGSATSSDRDRRVSLQSVGHSALSGGGDDAGQVVGSVGGAAPMPVPPRKRYSSSFGHRYAGSGGSSSTGVAGQAGGVVVGSAASGQSGLSGISGGAGVTSPLGATSTTKSGAGDLGAGGGLSGRNTPASMASDSRKEPLAPYLNRNTDDDDISIFVQDIDSRKPLLGRQKQHERSEQGFSLGQGHDREDTDTTIKGKQPEPRSPISTEYRRTPLADSPLRTSPQRDQPLQHDGSKGRSSTEVIAAASTSPTRGLMLTSQGEVDEKLKRMNETFLKSLEGLGSSGNSARRKDKDKDNDSPITTTTTSSKTSSTVTPFEANNSGVAVASGSGFAASGSSGDRSAPLASRGLGLGFPSRESASTSDSPLREAYGYFNAPSMGLGLGRARYASVSSSTLANSDVVGASQGSEEVIGKMDLYEERRMGGFSG